jgi:nicotinamide-nucleotide amidase
MPCYRAVANGWSKLKHKMRSVCMSFALLLMVFSEYAAHAESATPEQLAPLGGHNSSVSAGLVKIAWLFLAGGVTRHAAHACAFWPLDEATSSSQTLGLKLAVQGSLMAVTEVFLSPQAGFFPKTLMDSAAAALEAAKRKSIRIAAAETVTSGLLSACLTSVSGASQIFERGYVLYHDSAKATGLGVAESISKAHGAVSAEVTRGLAEGLLAHSTADVTVAVTGYAGPGGGNPANPVGTVYVAAAQRGGTVRSERFLFSGGRDNVRLNAVAAALRLLREQIET